MKYLNMITNKSGIKVGLINKIIEKFDNDIQRCMSFDFCMQTFRSMPDTVMSYNNNILLADIKDLFIIQLSN